MTEKQIEKLKDELNKKHYGNKCYMPENLICPWTREEEVLMQELQIREMINSILIYGGDPTEGTWKHDRYLKTYYEGNDWRNKGFVTRERVNELIEEQKADFAKAEVGFAGYDSEGVSYNYCRWADEM
jgi:hypothetical protein